MNAIINNASLSSIAAATQVAEKMFLAGVEALINGKDGVKEEVIFSHTPQLAKFRKVVKAVASNGGFIDDHCGKKVEGHPSYLVYIRNQRVMLVPAYAGGFSINDIELKDGIPHLSRWSVGGVVSRDVTLRAAACQYNAFEEAEYGFDRIIAIIEKTDTGYTVKAV